MRLDELNRTNDAVLFSISGKRKEAKRINAMVQALNELFCDELEELLEFEDEYEYYISCAIPGCEVATLADFKHIYSNLKKKL